MENEIKAEKSTSVYDRIDSEYKSKLSTMQTSGSRLFYVTILLLNIFTLVVACFLINASQPIEKITVVFENIGVQNILLLILVFLGIMVLKSLPDYLKIFSKTKKRKFLSCYLSNAKKEYYDCVTIYKKGYFAEYNTLSSSKIKKQFAADVVASKKIVNKISFVVYGLLFMILGAFLWVKYIPIMLYIMALLVIIFNVLFISFVVYFGKNKENATSLIANVCKFLFNKKIIKDYEKTFFKIVDSLIEYNKGLKFNKIIIWTEVFANMLIYFLKGLAIYLLCFSLNLIDGGIFFNVLFVWVVLESLLSIWPLQKGTLVFEYLFVLLFSAYFLEGFIFWALLLFRIFDYFLYALQYIVVIIIEFIAKKCGKKRVVQK